MTTELFSYSPHAIRVADVLDPARGLRRQPWGLTVHTTGGGVPSKARAKGEQAIDVALAVYRDMQAGRTLPYKWGGPTYVIDWGGLLYQLSPDEILTAHCGHRGLRDVYLVGEWVNRCSPATVAHWRRQWPDFPSPQHLFPGHDPNGAYVGVELVQLPEPRAGGLWFTDEQHRRVVELARDLAERHGWPEQWEHGPRLVGHEDLNPIERSDAGGGWCPGYLRASPRFDFEWVRATI